MAQTRFTNFHFGQDSLEGLEESFADRQLAIWSEGTSDVTVLPQHNLLNGVSLSLTGITTDYGSASVGKGLSYTLLGKHKEPTYKDEHAPTLRMYELMGG